MPADFPGGDGATVTLEVAWGYNSETLDSALSWTDESALLIQGNWQSGKSDPNEETTPAGRATFELSNTDRRFDPTHTGGALYSSINGKVGHPIRLRATKSAVTYDLWRGFIDRIDQGRELAYADNYATAVFTCSDALGDLAWANLPDSAQAVEYLRGVKFEDDGSAVPDPPIHWWRMGEQSGTVCRDSTPVASPGALNGTYTGTVAATYNYRQGLVAGSPDGAIEFDGTDMHVVLGSQAWTPPFTVVARIVLTTASKANPIIALTGTGSRAFSFSVNSSNFLTCTFHDGTDTRTATATTTTLAADTVYTVACAVLAGAAPKLYVNQTSQSVSSSGSGTLDATTLSGYIARSGSDYFSGIIDELAVWDFDVIALGGYNSAPSRIDDYHDVCLDAWDQDTFQLRTKKILDAVKHPVDRRTISTTSTWEYDPAEFAGMNAYAYLQEIARSEDGRVYVNGSGKVVCEDRRERYTQSRSTASQVTISDETSATYKYDRIIADGQDAAWVRTRIVARRKFGSDLVAETSNTRRGQTEDLGTLMLRSEANVRSLLARRLAARSTPKQHYRMVGWSPRSNGGQWPLLARHISDRVSVRCHPQGVGSAVTEQCWIEGVSGSLNTRTAEWRGEWVLSPAVSDPD